MKLTRKGFRAWLESKRPKSHAGMPLKSNCCPIARYLQANGTEATVGVTSYHVDGEETGLPRWAKDFVYEADGLDVRYITASRALKILASK